MGRSVSRARSSEPHAHAGRGPDAERPLRDIAAAWSGEALYDPEAERATVLARERAPSKGRILSLSTWRDEKALIRRRTLALHHEMQARGGEAVFADYHLRVGEIAADTHVPPGMRIVAQRLDATETGTAKRITLIEVTSADGAARPPNFPPPKASLSARCTLASPCLERCCCLPGAATPKWRRFRRPRSQARRFACATCGYCGTTLCPIPAKRRSTTRRSARSASDRCHRVHSVLSHLEFCHPDILPLSPQTGQYQWMNLASSSLPAER